MNIDLSYLEDITGGDKEMMVEMLDLFIEDIPKQVSLIEETIRQKELSNLAAESHKLKPTLQYIGLFDMFEIVKELEIIGKSGEFSVKIESLINTLQEHSLDAIPLLKKEREALT
ncbi:MAG: hypothetical protein BalsKO_23410 [Balneolaceae bacterium]